MAIRLEQIHPMLVHLPIALLPLSVGADALGRATSNEALMSFGKTAACAAAVGAVVSTSTGLIAGEEVNVEGEYMDMLITHRNLNVLATIVASGMAVWRFGRRTPSVAYLAVGAMGIGVVAYSAYLGGKLVYEIGAGVKPAKGVYREDAPTLSPGRIGEFVQAAGAGLANGVKHLVQEVQQGKLVPTLSADVKKLT